MNVSELLAAVQHEGTIIDDARDRGRYVAIGRFAYQAFESWIDENGHTHHREVGEKSVRYRLVGGSHIHTYRRLRNAIKAAGDGGFVCVLDLSHLPIVADEAVAAGVDDKNEIDEYSLAERQLEAWANRVRDLKARQSK